MNYLKFYKGGIVKKLLFGGDIDEIAQMLVDESEDSEYPLSFEQAKAQAARTINTQAITPQLGFGNGGFGTVSVDTSKLKIDPKTGTLGGATVTATNSDGTSKTRGLTTIKDKAFKQGLSMQLWGMLGQVGLLAIDAVDNAFMGDKNFGSQSAAIDSAVDATSSALMNSGNPYGMIAGAALKGVNFLSKAGGLTVQGFDANIENSGFGTLGHEDSSSSRGGILGLRDLTGSRMQAKLDRRNERARMALEAAEISEDIKFEQEARANSVDNVIMQNEMALNGGVDTQVLAAKLGAKLDRKPETITYHMKELIHYWEEPQEIVSAKNGAKLEQIEVSDLPNVIPEGAMHKNLNHIDLDVTKKGIPVITVEDDSVDTFAEIKLQEDTLVLHAEVEEAEIIFNKELTLFIENLRKLWHEEKDDSICLEAGMRLAKEILENTEDNTDVTEKSMEAVENENN